MRIAITLVVTLIVNGCAAWGADTKAGQSVYNRACRSCHGADGAPAAAAAKMLKVEMRDLKVALKSLSDAEVHKIIIEGKGKMVATKGVTAADADNAIAHMRATMK